MDIDVEDHDHDVALLRRSLALAERHIDAASNMADAPTPCVDWNAGQLVSHLIATLRANNPVSVADALMFPTFDVFIHSWDLAQVTGLEGVYPDDLTSAVAAWCHQVFDDRRRGDGIVTHAVAPPANATQMDELVAFLGRVPQATTTTTG